MSELPARGRGVALIGARGTGKTTVGRILAERLGCGFLDADRALATGGGAVLREANRARLHGFGLVVWLVADPVTLVARILAEESGVSGRPALTALGTLDEIEAIVAAREQYYQQAADFAIDTRESTPNEVAEAIL